MFLTWCLSLGHLFWILGVFVGLWRYAGFVLACMLISLQRGTLSECQNINIHHGCYWKKLKISKRFHYSCIHHQCIKGSWKGFPFVTFVTKPSRQSSLQSVVQGTLTEPCGSDFPKKVQLNSNKLLYKLILSLYLQGRGATKTEAVPRKLCREDTNDRAADTRSAAITPAGSGAQQPHKLCPPELLHPLLKRPGCFAFLQTQEKDLYALHWMI